jgi:hypothetical protein
MSRRLLTFLSAVSLALLVVIGVGWVSSANYDDVRVRWSGGRLLLIGTNASVTGSFARYFEPDHKAYYGPQYLRARLTKGEDPTDSGLPTRHAEAFGVDVYSYDGRTPIPDPMNPS